MRKHALLQDNIVIEIKTANADDINFSAYQLVIDVHDLIIPPQVGWILDGNRLIPPPGQQVNIKDIIMSTIEHYQSVAPALLRDLYATNTLLGITAQQSDQIFEEYSDVLIRLTQGAFPTAIYRLQQKEPSGFVTQEMIDEWISKIQALLL